MKCRVFALALFFLNLNQNANAADSREELSPRPLSVESAFLRSMEMRHGYLFSKIERDLLRHFVDTALEAYPVYTVDGFCAHALSTLDNYFQRAICEIAMHPNYDDLILSRKLIIKQNIETAIREGVEQIVFLGGGYDIRSLIVAAQNPNIVVYELDTGATRDNKIKCLRTIPFHILSIDNLVKSDSFTLVFDNLFYVDYKAKVTTTIEETIRPFGFSSDKKTLIIAEELTMDLDEDANAWLLKMAFSMLKHEGSKLLFGHNGSQQKLTIENSFIMKERIVPIERLNNIHKRPEGVPQYNATKESYFLLEKEDKI